MPVRPLRRHIRRCEGRHARVTRRFIIRLKPFGSIIDFSNTLGRRPGAGGVFFNKTSYINNLYDICAGARLAQIDPQHGIRWESLFGCF